MDYLWILVVSGGFAFFAAAGIGSNDAANAFATSVGSGALTTTNAVILACIFETSGAILMGGHVTETIRKGIADYECFEDDPYVLMYGCMWVLFSVGSWLFMASYLEMPVSTTHSCVGGMIGMSLALKGPSCVIWYKPVPTFPYVGGVSGIVLSWIISPVFSGVIGMVIYAMLRTSVLRKSFDSYRLNVAYPLIVGTTIVINTFFIIYKGAKGLGLDDTSLGEACALAFGSGSLCAIVTIPMVSRFKEKAESSVRSTTSHENSCTVREAIQEKLEPDVEEVELDKIVSIHEQTERFDERTEEVFKYMQIFTAMCDSFSHGANDVANAIGPFVAVYSIYKSDGVLNKKSDMEDDAYWILTMGGAGIAFGLLVYGRKIIRAIGTKLIKITPSRGMCIELSSALVIILGSRLDIPLSTTHCQVGSTIGVGMLEKHRVSKRFNYKILYKIVFGWISTCLIVGATAALLTSQGAYAPSV